MVVNLKYDGEITEELFESNLKRIINQVYKLLPLREEGTDWEKPLETLLEEIVGMDRLLMYQSRSFFPLICKLEGLFELTAEKDFQLFRRSIFECLNLLNEVHNDVSSKS